VSTSQLFNRVYKNLDAYRRLQLPLSDTTKPFLNREVDPWRLVDFLNNVSNPKRETDNIPSDQDQWDTIASDGIHRHGESSPGIIDSMLVNSFLGKTTSSALLKSLEALSLASQIYQQFPSAKIPLKIVSQPMCNAKWFPLVGEHSRLDLDVRQDQGWLLLTSRAQTFACIAMFESGGLDLDPVFLEGVFAMSSGNSLFVAGALLTDPAISLPAFDVKRITGNIGSPGISMLVSPDQPRMKSPTNDYRAVLHADYDYKREDNFGGTSLHLGFTHWKLPISSGVLGLIDQDVYMHEAVVSVHSCGAWVADIDVLTALRKPPVVLSGSCQCARAKEHFRSDHTSIDCWDEILDPPDNTGIIRAHGNWAARLAAVCILFQMPDTWKVALVDDEEVTCWDCLENRVYVQDQGRLIYID
jgi:hypothetical protein